MRNQGICRLLNTGFLLELLFSPESGGDTFPRKVGGLRMNNTALNPEDNSLHNDRRENLRSQFRNLFL
jgi:hypothetical protein